MPSDERSRRVLRALAAAGDPFHSAVVAAAEQVRAHLDAQRAPGAEPEAEIEGELGAFAAGRIDAGRFAARFGARGALEPATLARLRRAQGRLDETATSLDELQRLKVEPGGDLRDAVERRLGRIGRAFGAAQTVELLRSGRFVPGEHEALLDAFPFRQWNRAERQIAPPLVVEVDGADLRAAGLAEFLDGSVRIVLLVRGECAPAPLARLVTPGVLAMQTTVEEELTRLAARPGPAVAALVPEGAAEFVHDPGAGPALAARLAVRHLPTAEVRRTVDGQSPFQQAEELGLLAELAQLAALASSAETEDRRPTTDDPAKPRPAEDPAARLAAWLLRQADLTDLG